MKKQKRQETKPAIQSAPAADWQVPWWYWLAGLGFLFLVFEVYGPALHSPFVLDDLYLPYSDPYAAVPSIGAWVGYVRPLLMLSYWVDYRLGASDPHIYHANNVLLHFIVSIVVMFIAARVLEWAGVIGRMRTALAIFSGALFLLHPLQTESVAYIASRSEVLSVLFYYSAFAIFIYSNRDSMSLARAAVIVVLFGAAAGTKEHTMTLPLLILFTDFYWNRGGLRKNGKLYGLLALACVGGGLIVWRALLYSNTAGFNVSGLSPGSYFFTQCRSIWIYVRMFFLPFGQNIDPDMPVSAGILDYGAIFGLVALLALLAAAWIFRKRWPLACFGVFVFLLLLAPTSSFVPIRDVFAERRVYLPFIGLVLVALELLRRLQFTQAVVVSAVAIVACAALTYQRSDVWSTPLTLWQDSVEKSPRKLRPRFQLAFAQYQLGDCATAAGNFEKASHLDVPDYRLLVDWANALDCAGREDDAAQQFTRAITLNPPSAEAYVGLSAVYAKQKRFDEALKILEDAQARDPRIAQIYVNRGGIYSLLGNNAAAIQEYKRALAIEPSNRLALEGLKRLGQ